MVFRRWLGIIRLPGKPSVTHLVRRGPVLDSSGTSGTASLWFEVFVSSHPNAGLSLVSQDRASREARRRTCMSQQDRA